MIYKRKYYFTFKIIYIQVLVIHFNSKKNSVLKIQKYTTPFNFILIYFFHLLKIRGPKNLAHQSCLYLSILYRLAFLKFSSWLDEAINLWVMLACLEFLVPYEFLMNDCNSIICHDIFLTAL